MTRQGRTAPSRSDSSVSDLCKRAGACLRNTALRRGAGLFRSTKDDQDHPLRTSASDRMGLAGLLRRWLRTNAWRDGHFASSVLAMPTCARSPARPSLWVARPAGPPARRRASWHPTDLRARAREEPEESLHINRSIEAAGLYPRHRPGRVRFTLE